MELTLEKSEKEYLQKVWNVYGNRSQYKDIRSLTETIHSVELKETGDSFFDDAVSDFIRNSFTNAITDYYNEKNSFPPNFKELYKIIVDRYDDDWDPFEPYSVYIQASIICRYLQELQEEELNKIIKKSKNK